MLQADEITQIENHKDLSEFIRKLRQDYVNSPDEWENNNLPSYLEAMAAWVSDAEGYYQNTKSPMPEAETWKTVARVLYAATIYE